jgi:hypothetical protein
MLYAQITILLRHSTGLKFIVLILEIILLEGDHLLKHLVHVLDLHVAFTKVCNLAHSPNGHIPEHHGGGLVLGHVHHATVPPGVLEGQHCPHPLQAVQQGGVDNGQLQSLAGLYISVGHRLAVTNQLHICLLNGVPREINTVRGFKVRERNKPANRTS